MNRAYLAESVVPTGTVVLSKCNPSGYTQPVSLNHHPVEPETILYMFYDLILL